MAIELCLETSGFVVQAIDAGWVDHTISRHFNRFRSRGRLVEDADVTVQVERLPIEEATAIWLVDVCGANYECGAAEMRTSHERFSELVTDGRRTIRAGLDI